MHKENYSKCKILTFSKLILIDKINLNFLFSIANFILKIMIRVVFLFDAALFLGAQDKK